MKITEDSIKKLGFVLVGSYPDNSYKYPKDESQYIFIYFGTRIEISIENKRSGFEDSSINVDNCQTIEDLKELIRIIF